MDRMAAVYDRDAALAYGLALRLLHDPADAEDAVAEAFSSLGETTATRELVLRLTRVAALRRLPDRSAGGEPRPPDASGFSDDLGDRPVHAALGSLGASERAALETAYFDGASRAQVAARLGVAASEADELLRLALEKVQSFVDGALAAAPAGRGRRPQLLHLQRGRRQL